MYMCRINRRDKEQNDGERERERLREERSVLTEAKLEKKLPYNMPQPADYEQQCP